MVVRFAFWLGNICQAVAAVGCFNMIYIQCAIADVSKQNFRSNGYSHACVDVYIFISFYIYIYRRHFGLHVEILIELQVRGSKQSVGLLQTSYI